MNKFKQWPLGALAVRVVACVAGLLCVVLSVLMLADAARLQQMGGLDDPQLVKLRAELADSSGGDEALVELVRSYDLHVRQTYFRTQEQRTAGGALLLGAAVVCFLGFKLGGSLRPELPNPAAVEDEDPWAAQGLFRQLLAGAGLLMVVLALFSALVVRSDVKAALASESTAGRGAGAGGTPAVRTAEGSGQVAKYAAEASETLTLLSEEMKANWPALRGAGGAGLPAGSAAPTSWDVESGDGILWKAELPVHGYNSPIVWGKSVFLSGGDEEGFEVFCFDADTGEPRWNTVVNSDEELPEVEEETGYAAPTMTTDGERVFVIFATGDLAALDFAGNVVWQRALGVPDNPYGMGSSLMTDGQRLFVQYDHMDTQKVMAFNTISGEPLWSKPREHISWSSPALVEAPEGMQLILNDEAFVTAYDPATGAQLWQEECLGGEVAPSPAFDGTDILFVANEYAQATALKLSAGKAEVMWQYDDMLPEISSPLVTSEFCFILTTAGDAVCLNTQTGETLWEEEFDDGFSSSPVLAGDVVYAADIEGQMSLFRASATFERIATIDMGEPVFGTPAVAHGRLYIRGDETLYCIGESVTKVGQDD